MVILVLLLVSINPPCCVGISDEAINIGENQICVGYGLVIPASTNSLVLTSYL